MNMVHIKVKYTVVAMLLLQCAKLVFANTEATNLPDAQVVVDELGHGHVNDATLQTLEHGIVSLNALGVAKIDCGSFWDFRPPCEKAALALLYTNPTSAQRLINMAPAAQKNAPASTPVAPEAPASSAGELDSQATPSPLTPDSDHSASALRVPPHHHARAEAAPVAAFVEKEKANPVLGFVMLAMFFILYWAPWVVAKVRRHNDSGAIFVVNFFFGWTGIGWIIALVWAMTGNIHRNQEINLNISVSRERRRGWDDVHTIDASSSDALPESRRRSRGFITGAE
jgi:hypothetical protein